MQYCIYTSKNLMEVLNMDTNYQQEMQRVQLNQTIADSVVEEVDRDYAELEKMKEETGWKPEDSTIVSKFWNSYNAFFLRKALDYYLDARFKLFNRKFNDPYTLVTPDLLRDVVKTIAEKSEALKSLNKEYSPDTIKIEVDNYIAALHRDEVIIRIKRGVYRYTPAEARILTEEFLKMKIEELINDLSEAQLNLKEDNQEKIINTSFKYKTVLNELQRLLLLFD